jgi:2-amino-4-hydroxy-6-hydroxymethyldihydropteridine diphosphokinase/dihydropteroate synthase
MVESYLALGSNLGNRRENLEGAIAALDSEGARFAGASPVYRTPALLLPESPADWDRPFLNCVIKVETELTPLELLRLAKRIEAGMGRDLSVKWSPRTIDIDILLYGDLRIDSPELSVPHKALYERYFLLDALSFLCPRLLGGRSRYGKMHQGVFMGILNITPDSFSDGGKFNSEAAFTREFERWERELVPIIDIGAESTNPRAAPVSGEEERERLSTAFDFLRGRKGRKKPYLRPLLSVDTYRFETAQAALLNGFDIINDVNAMREPRMAELLAEFPDAKYVLMHSITVPPRADAVIEGDAVPALSHFLEEKLEIFARRGVPSERIIFDIGLGFGKTPYQSFDLLRRIEEFHKYGVSLLVGHSRKSFFRALDESEETRDADTLAVSLTIANKVDVLRVHTPVEHQNALLAYMQSTR